MKVLKWIGIALATVVLGIVLFAIGARFGDGPTGPFPGGELTSGEWVERVPEDWSFATDLAEMDFQLVEPLSSRRTWLVVRDGVLYIPCGFPHSAIKQWPQHARKNGDAVIRLDGKRYRVTLRYVDDVDATTELARDASRKYGLDVPETVDPDDIWLFAVEPRAGA